MADAAGAGMIRLKIPEPVWITTDSDLRAACQQWSQEPYLALDTEFMRTSTFYPQAGLVQVAGREGCFLIDPLQITDWTRSEEHTSELQSRENLVCRLLL